MPELPSIEIFKRFLESTSLKQEIQSVKVNNPEILMNTSQAELTDELWGQEFIQGKDTVNICLHSLRTIIILPSILE